jgi:hypothetical protein
MVVGSKQPWQIISSHRSESEANSGCSRYWGQCVVLLLLLAAVLDLFAKMLTVLRSRDTFLQAELALKRVYIDNLTVLKYQDAGRYLEAAATCFRIARRFQVSAIAKYPSLYVALATSTLYVVLYHYHILH